ncbi:MAG: hypothetical protein HY287_01605 [Planctomycetes bacterium]|nr:hypothetical protein [Planctomycetota bacterium]MBI3833004.1 hypothetical protein [Planctomycetota bacterium]
MSVVIQPQNEQQTKGCPTPTAGSPIARSEFAIGVLSVTAVVLFVSLLLVQSTPRSALGNGMASYGGSYAMGVGTLSIADEDALYIIDNATQKMIAYRFDPARNQINVMQGVDLGALRGVRGAAPAATNPANSPNSTSKPHRPPAPKPKSPPPTPDQPPAQPTP